MNKDKNISAANEPADNFRGTPITLAASKKDWELVRSLLKQGADARAVNIMGQNALYYAILYQNLDLAAELFDAGARLDALNSVMSEHGCIAEVLFFIARMRNLGCDLFFDAGNTLLECCSRGEYAQAAGKLDSATPDELTEAISALINIGRFNSEENLRLVEKMLQLGGHIDLVVVKVKSSLPTTPEFMQNPLEYTDALYKLAEKYN